MKTLAEKIAAASIKTQEILANAEKIFRIPGLVEKTDLLFNLKGGCAGQARASGARLGSIKPHTKLQIRLNPGLMETEEGWDHIFNDTIPHEIAHLVCFVNPGFGKDHDAGWKEVCKKLGGTGNRCHPLKTFYGKGGTWEYISESGKAVHLSDKRHAQVQSGTVLTYTKAGRVTKECKHTLVARSGRPINVDKPVEPKKSFVKTINVDKPVEPKPVEPKKQVEVKGGKVTNASRIRAEIAKVKSTLSATPSVNDIAFAKVHVINIAVNDFGMTKALATVYVKNNW